MRKVSVLLVSSAVVFGGWLALNLASAQTKEKAITLTEKQWEDLVQKRIAQAMSKEQVPDERILQPENWHTAVYKGVEYTIYTGPGQVMLNRLAPAQPRGPEMKPAESKPAAK
jgi:hypothetical protein